VVNLVVAEWHECAFPKKLEEGVVIGYKDAIIYITHDYYEKYKKVVISLIITTKNRVETSDFEFYFRIDDEGAISEILNHIHFKAPLYLDDDELEFVKSFVRKYVVVLKIEVLGIRNRGGRIGNSL